MTIGIAAYGPGAANAIVAALEVAEAIASGAIGGFVSLAAIHEGVVKRAEVQTGGTKSLFPGPPDWLSHANCAVLMSSGPNRPAPLAQFTPGDAQGGLVTGHRFPNMPNRQGVPLNLAALSQMSLGVEQAGAANDHRGDDERGDLTLVEDPGSALVAQTLALAGAEVIGVGVDEEGLDPDRLPARPAKLLHVTPSHQFPTGHVLPQKRRARCPRGCSSSQA